MHSLWEFRCIIDVLLEGIMGLMVAGDFATDPTNSVKALKGVVVLRIAFNPTRFTSSF